MTHSRSLPARKQFEYLLLAAGIAFCLAQVVLSWDMPLLDQYAFRQTQTALSTFWILKDHAWLAYPTPVLGAPWSIPLEFPLYQWVVAVAAANLHFLTLDQTGRLVSEFFWLGCLWPLWRIVSHHEKSKDLYRITVVLLLFSPLYAFWSRSFMIESTALFFSFWFVAALLDYQSSPSMTGFVEMAATAIIAACVKITTFFGFSMAGAMIVLWSIYISRENYGGIKWLARYFIIAIAVLMSLVCLWLWLHFSDALKSNNLLARSLTSEALTSWNFGTLQERFSIRFLRVVFQRSPGEAIGSWMVMLTLFLIVFIYPSRRQLAILAAMLIAYLMPFLVFTNLHLVHNYYQYANALFLILAVAYVLFLLSERLPVAATVLVVATVAFELYGYSVYFHDSYVRPNRQLQAMLAVYAKQHTKPAELIAGFGLSWSSEVPYYAERRALLISDSTDRDVLDDLNSGLTEAAGGHKIGAVIVCPNQLALGNTRASYQMLLQSLTRGKSETIVGYCAVYS